jgi:hypothetical protein
MTIRKELVPRQHFSDLPTEIIHFILFFFTDEWKQLLRLSLINRSWKYCVDYSLLWLSLELSFCCPKKFLFHYDPIYQSQYSHLSVKEYIPIYKTFRDPSRLEFPFHLTGKPQLYQILPVLYASVTCIKVIQVRVRGFTTEHLQQQTNSYSISRDIIRNYNDNEEATHSSIIVTQRRTPYELAFYVRKWFCHIHTHYQELWSKHLYYQPIIARFLYFYECYYLYVLYIIVAFPYFVYGWNIYAFFSVNNYLISAHDSNWTFSFTWQMEIGMILLMIITILYTIGVLVRFLRFLFLTVNNGNQLELYFNSQTVTYIQTTLLLSVGVFLFFILLNAKLYCLDSQTDCMFPWIVVTIPLWFSLIVVNLLAKYRIDKKSLSRMIFVLTLSICTGLSLICLYYDDIHLISSLGLASIPLYPACFGVLLLTFLQTSKFCRHWILCSRKSWLLEDPLLPQVNEPIDKCICARNCVSLFFLDLFQVLCCFILLFSVVALIIEGFYGYTIIHKISLSPVFLCIVLLFGFHVEATTPVLVDIIWNPKIFGFGV